MEGKMAIMILLASSLLLLGCTGGQLPPPPAGGNGANEAAVSIQGFAFSPSAVTIKAGGSVTWTNLDSAPHSISSATFSSPTLPAGETYKHLFAEPGTYAYNCGIHQSMEGTVIVE